MKEFYKFLKGFCYPIKTTQIIFDLESEWILWTDNNNNNKSYIELIIDYEVIKQTFYINDDDKIMNIFLVIDMETSEDKILILNKHLEIDEFYTPQ